MKEKDKGHSFWRDQRIHGTMIRVSCSCIWEFSLGTTRYPPKVFPDLLLKIYNPAEILGQVLYPKYRCLE